MCAGCGSQVSPDVFIAIPSHSALTRYLSQADLETWSWSRSPAALV